MATGQSRDVAMTDEQLLDEFVTSRDEDAFEALLHRHGPMVLGVCRRLLPHRQDVEDAFQATFLVLVRKAASLGQHSLLGNWLYGVAYRTALDARAAAIRRQKREKQVKSMPEPEIHDDSQAWRDLRPVLDRELNRLPDKYRIPIVLCDLEGRTRQDAAQQLGIPVGTLSGRLTIAREMLAKRLSLRGVTLSGAALMAVLTPSAASAAVPSPLVTSTVQAAMSGVFSSQAAALATGVMKAVLLTKLKIIALVLMSVVVGAASVVVHADMGNGGTGAAKVLDLGMGERGRRVVWSADGKALLVVTKVEKSIFGFQYDRTGSAIRLWNVENGKQKLTVASSEMKGLSFQDAVYSADAQLIAATVTEMVSQGKPIDPDKWEEEIRRGNTVETRTVVKIWDAKTLVLKQTLKNDRQPFALALSPNNKLVAAGSLPLMSPGNKRKKWIELWNTRTGKLERTLEFGEEDPGPISFAFSPDSKSFVIGCQKDGNAGQVQWWDAQTWKMKRAFDQDESVASVVFSANGKVLASASYKDSIQLWDAQKGEPVRFMKGVKGPWRGVALSPDGRTVAAASNEIGKVRLWDTETGELKKTLKGHSSQIYSLAFSPDGKTLASTSQDATVRLWPMTPVDREP